MCRTLTGVTLALHPSQVSTTLGDKMDKIKDLITVLKGGDDLGVVIRSHIIVEQYLNALIESLLRSPEHFRKIKLDYNGTVKLAISLGLNPRFESSLNAIGTIRNDFAHNMRHNITVQDANNLYNTLDSNDKSVLQSIFESTKEKIENNKIPKYKELKPKDKFILNIMVICGNLHTACNLSPNLSNSADPKGRAAD